MRRWIMPRTIVMAATAAALLAALAVGPLGAAGAGPYVYGCTPATIPGTDEFATYLRIVSIYNGSATAGTVTAKWMMRTGGNIPTTQTVPATQTMFTSMETEGGDPAISLTVPASLRIVSSVPVAASLTHHVAADTWVVSVCTPLLP